MSTIHPFKIAVAEERIHRLKQQLAVSDLPDEVTDAEPWVRGPPVADMRRLVDYWQNHFDWRVAEARLNQFPQFTTNVAVEGFGDFNIHFVHQTSPVQNAIPLLFIHGWPGSFIEVIKIIPELSKGGSEYPAFHIVAPSLVNFGFSDGCTKKGFNTDQHAEVCHKLMLALGYDEYVTQGGDLGYFTSRTMVARFPQHVKAHHINLATPARPTITKHPQIFAKSQVTPLSEQEKAGLARTQKHLKSGSAYFKIQATKPQTIGYTITASPVGLLGWIYEKLHDWTDNYPWTDDEILTWISIYYFSKAGPAASQRIYYEDSNRATTSAHKARSYYDVKLGIARFPKELSLLPKLWAHTMGPVVYESEYDTGGHFAAWERPDAIVKDLRNMFGRSGGAYACVKGKDGYSNPKGKL